MNALLILAVTWVGKEYRFAGLDWSYLVVLGMIGNATFSMRFLVQWIASERQGESVIPISFWYWSIAGSIILSAEFLNLHSQSGADPAAQVCADRGRAVTATARIGLEETWFTAALVFRSPASLDQHLPPGDAPLSNPSPCESAPGHLDDRRKRI